MAKYHTESRLKRVLKKVTRPQSGWTDESDKVMGLADGTVLTGIPGMVYVRDPANGQVLTVYNSVAPTDRPGLQVRVGKLVGESIYRIKGMRDAYGVPAGGSSGSDHSHDNLFMSRERFLPFLVLPIAGGGHVVQIYGDVIARADRTFSWVPNQTLDLSAYVPTSGAKYVLIEADDDGNINVVDGTPVDAKELLTPANIPAHTEGSKPSCAVRLFVGQTQLYRDPNSINDFIDVRSLTSGGGGGGSSFDIHALDEKTVIVDDDEFPLADSEDSFGAKKVTKLTLTNDFIQSVLAGGGEEIINPEFDGNADGWDLGTGWTYDDHGVVHTPGNEEPMSQSGSLLVDVQYSVLVATEGSTGSIFVNLGDDTDPVEIPAGGSFDGWIRYRSDDPYKIIITPTSDFDGKVIAAFASRWQSVQDAPGDGIVYGRKAFKWFALMNPTPPSTASSLGEKGQMAVDSDYLYICVDENTWKRVELSSWT